MSSINITTAEAGIQRLIDGNERFVEDKLDGKLQNSQRRGELTTGQSPYAVILSCADSRVVPELAFDTGLGELFVVRVAGNVANSESIASIEYAVAALETPLIVVLGHESCGAVGAAIEGKSLSKDLDQLVAHIQPAVAQCGEHGINEVVKCNAKNAADQLVSGSEIIAGAVESGKLTIKSAYYNLGSGKIDWAE